MTALLKLSLRQMTGGKRLILLVLLAAIPVGLTALLTALSTADSPEFHTHIVDGILATLMLGAILPVVVMTLATAAFGNELEDRTLNVLVLKPVSRASIILPKLLGSILVAGPLIIVAGVAVTAIALGDAGPRGLLAAAVALLAGVVAYATVFTWAGLVSTRALGFGLVYVFLWEGVVTSFLSGVRYLSIRWYALGILHGADPTAFSALDERAISLPASLIGVAVVTVVFFLLAVRRLQRMDVP